MVWCGVAWCEVWWCDAASWDFGREWFGLGFKSFLLILTGCHTFLNDLELFANDFEWFLNSFDWFLKSYRMIFIFGWVFK